MAENEKAFMNASVAILRQTAGDVVSQAVDRSKVFDADAEASLPKFETKEIVVGRVLGRGGFCVVHEIDAFKLPGMKDDSFRGWKKKSKPVVKTEVPEERLNEVAASSRADLASQCKWNGKPRFVLKRLPDDWKDKNKMTFLKGTVDLALEAKYLAILKHPHISRIRGLARVGPVQDGYSLVLDRVNILLYERLKKWAVMDRQSRGITGALTGGKKKKVDLMTDRFKTAYDIASAMAYIHGLNIIYRDLKPDNIGFDYEGEVKIFDFGLAKELRDDEKEDDGNYRMTALTGAIRYMAPEVGRKKPYNLSADVYSFGMVFWCMMALEVPFAIYTPNMIADRVFERGHRPATLSEWPDDLSSFMKSCWDEKPGARPDFEGVKTFLREQIYLLRPDVADSLDQNHGSIPNGRACN